MLAHDGADDVVDRVRLARRGAGAGRVVDVAAPAVKPTAVSASGSFELKDRRDQRLVGRSEGAREGVLEDAAAEDEAERGSNTAQIRASGIRRPEPGEAVLGDRRRVMGEVVVHRHAATGHLDDLQPALDAGKELSAPLPCARRRCARPQRSQSPRARHCARCTRREAATRMLHKATLCAARENASTRRMSRDRAPASRLRRRRRTSRRARTPRRPHRARPELSAPTSSRPGSPRHEIHAEAPERQRHGVEVSVDVRVIELDVVDDRECPAGT